MNHLQFRVSEFHKRFNVPIESVPAIRRGELRAKLIKEEMQETVDAIRAGNLVEAVDGICDSIYVLLGACLEFGITDITPYFEEVHRANMEKIGGSLRADGKILKPEGWQPPDLESILARCGPNAD